jgi:hypothetical protein
MGFVSFLVGSIVKPPRQMLPFSYPFVPPVLLPYTSHSPNNTHALLISECLLFTIHIRYKLYDSDYIRTYIEHHNYIVIVKNKYILFILILQ